MRVAWWGTLQILEKESPYLLERAFGIVVLTMETPIIACSGNRGPPAPPDNPNHMGVFPSCVRITTAPTWRIPLPAAAGDRG